MYSYCNDQYEIYQFDKNLEGSIRRIEKKGRARAEKLRKAVILQGLIGADGKILFQASRPGLPAAQRLCRHAGPGPHEGGPCRREGRGPRHLPLQRRGLFRDVQVQSPVERFYRAGRGAGASSMPNRAPTFVIISTVIIVITVIIGGIGIFILRFLLRYIDVITRSIMKMVKSQQLELIDLSGATNDDITYLGAAFNSLSSTVDNLITIFRKFANQDVVIKAYRDRDGQARGHQPGAHDPLLGHQELHLYHRDAGHGHHQAPEPPLRPGHQGDRQPGRRHRLHYRRRAPGRVRRAGGFRARTSRTRPSWPRTSCTR